MNHKQYNGLGIIFGYQNTQQYVAEANEKMQRVMQSAERNSACDKPGGALNLHFSSLVLILVFIITVVLSFELVLNFLVEKETHIVRLLPDLIRLFSVH